MELIQGALAKKLSKNIICRKSDSKSPPRGILGSYSLAKNVTCLKTKNMVYRYRSGLQPMVKSAKKGTIVCLFFLGCLYRSLRNLHFVALGAGGFRGKGWTACLLYVFFFGLSFWKLADVPLEEVYLKRIPNSARMGRRWDNISGRRFGCWAPANVTSRKPTVAVQCPYWFFWSRGATRSANWRNAWFAGGG